MREITTRQKIVFEFIRDFIRTNNRSPTIREIGKGMGINSTNGVLQHLNALEKKGYIERDGKKARAIRLKTSHGVLESSIPNVARVVSGTSITAIENIENYWSLADIFGDPGNLFSLSMVDDGMTGVGIYIDDLVIARKQSTVEHDEIGVVIVDGKAIVRKVNFKGEAIKLIPENRNYNSFLYDPIKYDFQIAGKVVGLVRRIQEVK